MSSPGAAISVGMFKRSMLTDEQIARMFPSDGSSSVICVPMSATDHDERRTLAMQQIPGGQAHMEEMLAAYPREIKRLRAIGEIARAFGTDTAPNSPASVKLAKEHATKLGLPEFVRGRTPSGIECVYQSGTVLREDAWRTKLAERKTPGLMRDIIAMRVAEYKRLLCVMVAIEKVVKATTTTTSSEADAPSPPPAPAAASL